MTAPARSSRACLIGTGTIHFAPLAGCFFGELRNGFRRRQHQEGATQHIPVQSRRSAPARPYREVHARTLRQGIIRRRSGHRHRATRLVPLGGRFSNLRVLTPRCRPRPHRRCWPSGPDLSERWPSRLVATTVEEDRLEHLTTHSVAGIGEPPALACSQGLPGPSPEEPHGLALGVNVTVRGGRLCAPLQSQRAGIRDMVVCRSGVRRAIYIRPNAQLFNGDRVAAEPQGLDDESFRLPELSK